MFSKRLPAIYPNGDQELGDQIKSLPVVTLRLTTVEKLVCTRGPTSSKSEVVLTVEGGEQITERILVCEKNESLPWYTSWIDTADQLYRLAHKAKTEMNGPFTQQLP